MKKFIVSVFLAFEINFGCFASNNAMDIYLLAQSGSMKELKAVENIDVVDSDGNTALCSAIKDSNVNAYNLLKNAGANVEHKCIKKIPTEQYEHFITKVASASKPWSFLGLGKWAWTAIGVGVAGGAAAAGMGGGSGGSDNSTNNNNYMFNCGANAYYDGIQCFCHLGYENWTEGVGCSQINCGPNAHHNGTQCICDWGYENWIEGVGCSQINCGANAYYDGIQCVCHLGYGNWIEGVGCYPTNCGENATQQGTQCVCDSGYTNWTMGYGCYQTLNCGANKHQVGDECVCDSGYVNWIPGGDCYPELNCGANATQQGNQCVCDSGYENWTEGVGCSLTILTCGVNAHQEGTQCVCDLGYQDWTSGYGCYQTLNCGENAYQEGTQCVCDTGYENWIEGIGCSVICGANAHKEGTQCICDSGYQNWVFGTGCELTPINCGTNAYQNGTECECYTGYENWTEGVGCELIQLSCGENAHQEETQCVCDSGYTQWTSGVGCYQQLNCGYHAYQSGSECVCNTGYIQWTVGYGCYSQMNCGANATQQGNQCVCDSGYTQWTSGVGCYVELDCGANASQNGASCQCDNGYENWTSGVGCSLIPIDCGANAHQEGTQCICDSGYTFWTQGFGCHEHGDCGTKAYYDGVQCVCEPGYTNWQQNIGCSLYGELDGVVINNFNPVANQNIVLHNESDAYVYGVFSNQNNVINNSAYIDSAVSSHSSRYTNITNSGDGNVYGICTNSNFSVINSVANIANNISVSYSLANATYSVTSSGSVGLNNTGDGDIYGIYGTQNVYNAKSMGELATMYGSVRPNFIIESTGHVSVTNQGEGDVYGMYNGTANASTFRGQNENYGKMKKCSNGYITLNNTGNGDVYGIYGNAANALSDIPYGTETSGSITFHYETTGQINITNTGNGSVYGIYGNGKNVNSQSSSARGYMTINNTGNGNVYGIYGNGENVSNVGSGRIDISNHGDGYVYGIKGTSSAINVSRYNLNGKGDIFISNYNTSNTNGAAYGLFANRVDNVGNNSSITIINNSYGTAYGMYGNDVYNGAQITIDNLRTGSAFGIFGTENSTVKNQGTITLLRDYHFGNIYYGGTPEGTAGDVFGIYAKAGSTVYNWGTIDITTDGTAYGIYVEPGSTVTNTGTIKINNYQCTGTSCGSYHNAIVLNGSALYNSGQMIASQMNLNSMGGNVVAGLGSQFVVDNELSGDLDISSEIVALGNQTQYIAENMIDAGDISGLKVRSASAMFNASLADNGHDIIMTMKDLNSLTDNKSLANFLANNYANGNGSDLFATLKSMENMSAFNGALSGLTGLNTFTQFAHEDLSAMREISFSMNNKLFENSNRDSFDISDSMGYFSFSDSHNSGNGQYGISNEKISDNWKLGYGMAMANLYTNDGGGLSRQNKMWLFYMPATYTNDGYELVVAPKAGFAHSEYNRRGYNNVNYEGYIEKTIFGLMNDLRYPFTFGNWTLAPDLAFNTIVYDQSGHEDEQEFSLVIPDDRTVSVETGLGFYTKYEKIFSNGSRLKLNSGLMAYREFGDTYDIKLGMRGMDGTFSLYNNDYKYRGAASVGFDYTLGYLHLYGNAQYFMDNANYMNFKSGVSYRF